MISRPTIRNTSHEMPKMAKSLSPIRADATRIIRLWRLHAVSAMARVLASALKRLNRRRRGDDGQHGHDCLHCMVNRLNQNAFCYYVPTGLVLVRVMELYDWRPYGLVGRCPQTRRNAMRPILALAATALAVSVAT